MVSQMFMPALVVSLLVLFSALSDASLADPSTKQGQLLAGLEVTAIKDWTSNIGRARRGRISRHLSEANGFKDDTAINICMRALARHDEFQNFTIPVGLEACIERGRKLKW